MYESFIALGIIAGLIVIWILVDRKNIEFTGPILIRRTQRGVKLLESVALRLKKVWKAFGLISIPIGLVFLCFIYFQLFQGSYNILTQPEAPPGAGPLLPWKYKGAYYFHIPGTGIYIPLWQGLIALAVVIASHELAHGLVAKAENLRIKSLAFALLIILPGAGVELDEKQIEKTSRKKKLEVFSAGSASNILVGFLFLFLVQYLLIPHFFETKTVLVNTSSGFPAENLTPGLIVEKVNGMNPSKFFRHENITPGETIILETSNDTYEFKTVPDPDNPEKGIIGIRVSFELEPIYHQIFKPLLSTFFWIYALNFGIGLINLLPLEPLDGGKIFKTLISPIKSKKKREWLTYAVFSLSLTLILFNIIGPYIF